MQARRLLDHPIISPDTPGWDKDAVGTNINGPSLIRVPEGIENPLGRYYLYFAHHQGKSIRLAYADELTGPWTIHTPGTLAIEQTPFRNHIASPDLHVLPDRGELVMIYHGCGGVKPAPQVEQPAAVAISRDGLSWEHREVLPAESYLRAFELEGRTLGVSKAGRLYEASPGGFDFDKRVGSLDISGRHYAMLVEGDDVDIFYSRWGDAPEHLLHFRVTGWEGLLQWNLAERRSLLRPERDWEGAGHPVHPSRVGSVHEPVNELRDPAVFRDDDGRRYLVYSVAGESGLGLAELTG
ncbi:MAG: hypothetical protein ACOC3G_07150 [Phycisphaeraceae bacterium]